MDYSINKEQVATHVVALLNKHIKRADGAPLTVTVDKIVAQLVNAPQCVKVIDIYFGDSYVDTIVDGTLSSGRHIDLHINRRRR